MVDFASIHLSSHGSDAAVGKDRSISFNRNFIGLPVYCNVWFVTCCACVPLVQRTDVLGVSEKCPSAKGMG